ncbi:hypothetical protein [Algivirga pacifica]|uniref:DNA primase n=1 Tax=Algivirga pacifica TaxID=1162670 RepID=A0ABP9D6W0_9BACT
MTSNNKLRVTKDYSKLSDELQEQIKLVYPEGFSQFLIQYTDKDGKRQSALRFETDDKIYLVRMTTEEAEDIISNDEDYDEYGSLRDDVRDEYEDKYSDVDYLTDNENYDG